MEALLCINPYVLLPREGPWSGTYMVASKNKLSSATSCASKEDASSLHLLTLQDLAGPTRLVSHLPGWLRVTSFVTITAIEWRLRK
jgi:hypothetical protein